MKTIVIAEAGVNHNADINMAFKLVDIAKESGADIVKFQTAIPPAVSEWHCFETISRSDVKRTIFDQYKMYICIQTVQNVQNVCTKCKMYIISNCKP